VTGKKIGAVVSVLVVILMLVPIGYQYLSKTTLEEQAPPLIESWLLRAFPGEFETGSVRRIDAPWTFAKEVPLPVVVMTKSGSLDQVCVTFRRDTLLGEWYAVGECMPAKE